MRPKPNNATKTTGHEMKKKPAMRKLNVDEKNAIVSLKRKREEQRKKRCAKNKKSSLNGKSLCKLKRQASTQPAL